MDLPFLPLLISGIPGVPGLNAFLGLRRMFPGRVFGIAPPHLPDLRQPGSGLAEGLLAADPEDAADLERLFREWKFRGVLDASGWCALKPCEHDRALARRLNVDAGVNLMRAAARHGARLVRLSTDLVFDGRPAPGARQSCAWAATARTAPSPPSPSTAA